MSNIFHVSNRRILDFGHQIKDQIHNSRVIGFKSVVDRQIIFFIDVVQGLKS